MIKNWFERYSLRLATEKVIMKETYPQFVLKMDRDNRLFWDGLLKTNFGTLYRVNILYPRGYPYEKPKLLIVEPPLRRDAPHRFGDGSICVYPEGWNYKRTTAPSGIPLVAGWLALYEVFLRTGKGW
jgi:hypothetical protein